MRMTVLLGSVLLISTAQAQPRERPLDPSVRADCDTVKKNADLCRNANENQRDLCRRMVNFLRECAANFDKSQQRSQNQPSTAPLKTIRLTPIQVLAYRDTSANRQQKQAIRDFMAQFYMDIHSPERTAELYWEKDKTTCTWDTPQEESQSMPPIDFECEENQGVVVTGRLDTENRVMMVHLETDAGRITADANVQMRLTDQRP